MSDNIIARCEAKGLRMTDQRRTVARVIEAAEDHPDVEELYARASAVDPRISLATVYRTVKLFEEAGILDKLEFGDGRGRKGLLQMIRSGEMVLTDGDGYSGIAAMSSSDPSRLMPLPYMMSNSA